MSNNPSNTCAIVVYSTGMQEDHSPRFAPLMQPIAGLPAILHVLKSAEEATGKQPILLLDQDLGAPIPTENIVLQSQASHLLEAILQDESLSLKAVEHLLFVPADMPLLRADTIRSLVNSHIAASTADRAHKVIGFAGASSEIDLGIFSVPTKRLSEILSWFQNAGLSDILTSTLTRAAHSMGWRVQEYEITDPGETLRVISRVDHAHADAILRERINHDLMHHGVSIIDPHSTYIDLQVEIGEDTVIYPQTYLQGSTRIGKACLIGPNSLILDTRIGDRCEIKFSVAESAVLEDDVDIGPFAHLRKGAHLARGVHMGNYGEVKNSYLGPGTKMGHFSYVGDANIGAEVNIGAGVITANYDGQSKHHTEIGAGAFIGSDTMLVAPLRIGEGSHTGAGSVVTKDVPPNSLAVGIPARVIRKKEEKDGP